ncbi:MAG: PAS domain S-box protein, partial [Vicinamibacteria bacterium]
MDSLATALDENRRLRRTMGDLVALSTLPAVWIGLGPEEIARSLADVLFNTLSLDFIYVRLTDPQGTGSVEVVRSRRSATAHVGDMPEALVALLRAGPTDLPPTMPDPFGEGTLHVAVTRSDVSDDTGVLVTGSSDAAFPTEQDRLLLGVGANQTAIVVQRRRAEEQEHAHREWLRVTLASIGDGVIATDTECRVTFLNAVAQELTGWTQADAEGKKLEAVFVILNERTRQPVENPVERVLREGVVVGLGNHTILIARDGTQRPIDDSAAPIRDAAGKMRGAVLIFRDVAHQRQAERELRASEARKSAVLQTALDCIVTMDHKGRVVEFNPAAERTFGYRREVIVGKELSEFIIPPNLREAHRRGLTHYLASGVGPVLGKRLEISALRSDGSEFPVELAITRNSDEDPPMFTAYLRDISEAKRAERHRNIRLAVTHVLSEATTAEAGAVGVLEAICNGLDWDVGFLWRVSEIGQELTFA